MSYRSTVCHGLALATVVLSSILVAMLPSRQAVAAGSMARTQAPGFYRMMLGVFEITALSDGTHPFPVHKVLTKTSPVNSKSVPLDQVSPAEADALLAESDLTLPLAGSRSMLF